MMRLLRFGLRRRADRCPREWVLTQHVSGELTDTRAKNHIGRCPRCASQCASLRRVVTQAQELDAPAEMTADARNAIAALLLATDPESRSGRIRPVVAVGVPAAALLIAAVFWGTRGPWRAPTPSESTARTTTGAPDGKVPLGGGLGRGHDGSLGAGSDPVVASPRAAAGSRRSRAAIRAIGAARFTRVQLPPDDVVRLDDGTIVIEVAPLPGGERFRVKTEDGEVEVRGTRFQVSASRGKLTAVTVASGHVEVRSAGGGHVVLDPGDEWVSGAEEAVNGPNGATSNETGGLKRNQPGEAAASGEPARPLSKSRGSRAPAGPGVVDQTADPSSPFHAARASFDRAWSLLRQGDARRAAALFAEVERTSGDGDIAEDALYWQSVATARAGERHEARALFEGFLRRFPSSSRAGGAAAALGWLYVENGQTDEARRAFERATEDPSPVVRASARDGLRRTNGP